VVDENAGVIYLVDMPSQRSRKKTQTSISLSAKELEEMRDFIDKNKIAGIGSLLEILWKKEKDKQTNNTNTENTENA